MEQNKDRAKGVVYQKVLVDCWQLLLNFHCNSFEGTPAGENFQRHGYKGCHGNVKKCYNFIG